MTDSLKQHGAESQREQSCLLVTDFRRQDAEVTKSVGLADPIAELLLDPQGLLKLRSRRAVTFCSGARSCSHGTYHPAAKCPPITAGRGCS